MTHFLRQGNSWIVAPEAAMDMHATLPPATYTVKQNPQTGALYLEMVEGFQVPSKLYGDTSRTAERILRTFGERTNSTGVLLSGEQGSGKTMLAKLLSVTALRMDIPTILIAAPWCGEDFNAFLQQITQPVVVIFDEFEKVYDEEEQEKMLTLLDGVYPSKKLYILTCNDTWRLNRHMQNRPGRLFYSLNYEGLDSDFIHEYCVDNLKNKAHIDGVIRVAGTFASFNFDILKAMVEEMNRYDETAPQVMKFLNASPSADDSQTFNVTLEIEGVKVPSEHLFDKVWRGRPLADGNSINICYSSEAVKNQKRPRKARSKAHVHSPATSRLDELLNEVIDPADPFGNDNEQEAERLWVTFSPADLKQVDEETGALVFMSGQNKVTLKKVVVNKHNWDAF